MDNKSSAVSEVFLIGFEKKRGKSRDQLEGAVLAEKTRLMHTIDHLEKRLKKTEEKNYETVLSQLMTLKNKLFPNGGIQERTENYLNFQLNDPQFIQKLLGIFDPLDSRMLVLKD